jgi:hypothetical protein
MQTKLRDLLDVCRDVYFSEGPSRQLFEFLKSHPDFKGDPKLAAQLQEIGDYVKIITLQFEELYQDLPLADLRSQAESLVHRLIDRYVKIQKHQLALAMEAAPSDAQMKELIDKADKLNELIR